MKRFRNILAMALVVLLGATVYGLVRTAETQKTSPSFDKSMNPAPSTLRGSLVDQTPLLTAVKLAQMPPSLEEQPLAQEALRLADLEMDIAYAAAEREVEQNPPALSAEAKAIQARLEEAEDALHADDTLVERLTAEEAKASGAKKDALHDQLVLATAHQEEHQDEVDDAREDLNRAGGDPKNLIEGMIQEHKASSHAVDAMKVPASPPVEERGLVQSLQHWLALHQKQLLLWKAQQAGLLKAADLAARHIALEAQMGAEKASASQSATPPKAGQKSPGPETQTKLSSEESATLVKAAKQRSANQKALSSFDKQIADEKQLADNYGRWIDVVAGMQRSVVHRALIGFTIILAILLIGLFFEGWFERLLGKTALDRRQVETLRTVTRVSVQVLAVLFILLVIFGPPGQLGTFLGLAGAGLTVALKDFIVGFIGWFVLMGKNGIRLGDWVEINGVTGEVVEIGPIHTVLLETGNWTDSGHPTGRRVTFTNSFAIEGHYFNFSTSGQWLWDELQLALPAGQDPYPMVQQIQKRVLEATAESAKEAEAEWKRSTRSREMSSFSVAPAISVKPVVGGIEVAVRYITRASERYQLRAKLYEAAVDLLGHYNAPLPSRPPAKAVPALDQ
jgi:small-conductance mechanosensitive channel